MIFIRLLLLCVVALACEQRPHLSVPAHIVVADSQFVMEGIQFESSCYNNNNLQVRVDVFSQFQTGVVQLHSAYSDLADFVCTTRNWSCHESGGKSLTFLASPMDVTAVLYNLTFVPFVAGDDNTDTIVIRVYSGQGGNCWDEATTNEDASSSEHPISGNHCINTQGKIQLQSLPVPIEGTVMMDFLSDPETNPRGWFQSTLFDCVVILLVGCLLSCCCGIRYWWIQAEPLSMREYMPEARDQLIAIDATA